MYFFFAEFRNIHNNFKGIGVSGQNNEFALTTGQPFDYFIRSFFKLSILKAKDQILPVCKTSPAAEDRGS